MATVFIFGIPFLRELPVKAADIISDMAVKNKLQMSIVPKIIDEGLDTRRGNGAVFN
jgi:hypothetical protein